MPDENDLRRLLAETDAPHRIDPATIVSRSRRRRLPRQLAAGTFGVLAIAGVGVLAVNVSTLQGPASTTAEQATMSDSAPESSSGLEFDKRGGADVLNACGAPLAVVDPSRYGLELTVQEPTGSVATEALDAVVVLTNTSAEAVDGFAALAPTLTMSRDNVVVAQGTAAALDGDGALQLEPGESVEYPVRIDLTSCSVDGVQVPAPGTYDLSAAVDFAPAEPRPDEPALADLVTGPPTSITLD